MGNYNPHAPHILGQEWVPIRGANYVPDDVTERGYTFRLEHGTIPVSGAYYVENPPENEVSQVVDMISVYPAGREALTGPIKSVKIRPSALNLPNPPNNTIIPSLGIAALYNSSDDQQVLFQDPGGDGGDEMEVSFDTEPYAALLLNKRILDIRVNYSVGVTDLAELQHVNFLISHLSLNARIYYRPDQVEGTLAGSTPNRINSFSLTDANPFWQSTTDANLVRDIYPWRFQELNKFRAGAGAERLALVVVTSITPGQLAGLGFLELEVIYCEETRVLYGGRRTSNINVGTHIYDAYYPGQQLVRLLTPTFSQPSTLAPGDYTVTLNHNNLGIFTIYEGAPTVHAVRELYQLPQQRGLRVHQSTTLDDQFTVTLDDSVLTQITLHTAASIVTGCHPYGTRYGAPVYGTVTATQEIEDDPVGTARTYQQVRFYARRFGNTTVPLVLADVATGTFTVSITPAELDALPEIVDGWREVTLRFVTPPSFATAAGDVDWRWSATGELAGNQWQVMVADGPGTSVTSPASHAAALATGKATYYAPQGDTVDLIWQIQSPAISGTAEDTTADAVLIFSQDPPAVSGLSLEILTQEVTGIGLNCGTPPGCIPTGISYIHLEWTAFGLCDAFGRVETASWGIADSEQTYVIQGGAAASQFNVNGEHGTITPDALNTDRIITVALPDTGIARRAVVDFSLDAVPASGTLISGLLPRFVDASNWYAVTANVDTTGVISVGFRKRVVGALTTPTTVTTPFTLAAGVFYTLTVEINGSNIMAKVEPKTIAGTLGWQLQTSDTSIATGSLAGVYARNQTAVTTHVHSFDNLSVTSLDVADGSVELQRRDSYLDVWQTIMDATRAGCVGSFDDYEARVGVLSEYRIRALNVLDFAGPWVTGAATLPAPGVDILGGNGNSVLIFTSNAAPQASLAYVMQWENEAIETFAFPEANFVQLQRIFGRDYFTAFYPLERGGEQFNRTLLVNAAAITPQALDNFSQLRDLAWAQLDYVCVRDELGNRWLANVRVPDGTVHLDRTVYMAQIQVAQLTDTPTPIDPSA